MIDTGTDELLCEIDGGIATLTLNRPHKRNALSDRLTPALRAMLPHLEAQADVRGRGEQVAHSPAEGCVRRPS